MVPMIERIIARIPIIIFAIQALRRKQPTDNEKHLHAICTKISIAADYPPQLCSLAKMNTKYNKTRKNPE